MLEGARLSLVPRDPNNTRQPLHALTALVKVPIDFLKLVLGQAARDEFCDLPRREVFVHDCLLVYGDEIECAKPPDGLAVFQVGRNPGRPQRIRDA